MDKPIKPLGRKAYGSIPHLPGSRLGPGDHHCHAGQEVICCAKARDKHDRIIITEKLDGGNVAVAKIDGRIWALGRAGFPASTSPFEQHHHFDAWVNDTVGRWSALLKDGEAVHGEWLAMAHGTIYDLQHEPFVAFDITTNGKRVPHDELVYRASIVGLTTPAIVSDGPPMSVPEALALLGENGRHGAREPVEGLVYRVERKGQFDYLAKYVRPDKEDGKYITEITGHPGWWHYRHAKAMSASGQDQNGLGAQPASAVRQDLPKE